MSDICSLGELLVDFTPNGGDFYQYNPGGGPANMACMAKKMSASVAFLGQVGNDTFGIKLKEKLMSEGVDVSGLNLSEDYPTTLAFVHWSEGGERSFSFYRHGSADTMIEISEEGKKLIKESKIFFLSSVLMSEGSSRKASFDYVRYAKEKGVLVAFDPNVRLNLWEDQEECRHVIKEALIYPEIVKVSEEELAFLTKEESIEDGIRALYEEYPQIKLLLLTLGGNGSMGILPNLTKVSAAPYPVEPVDTTGAGDAFTGAFLGEAIAQGVDFDDLSQDRLLSLLKVANAAGGLTTTQKGGIDSQPSKELVYQTAAQA